MTDAEGDRRDSRIEQGGAIPGCEAQAYTLEMPVHLPLPVLIAVPHAGREYPANLISNMRQPGLAASRLEDRKVDVLAREVARLTGAALLVANAPRAMIDLNRAKDDVDWEMIAGAKPPVSRHSHANRRARSGLGLIPRRLPQSGEIWRGPVENSDLQARISGVHRPYHTALASHLEKIRDDWGAALLIDMHSMPPLKPRFGAERPAHIVVGDRFGASCDNGIVERALSYIEAGNRPVAHNRPYSGGYVLDRHAAPQRGLHAIQLEICRSIYLDAQLMESGPGLEPLARFLAGLVRELGAATANLSLKGPFAQAAE